MAKKVVILLHGVGSNGNDLSSLGSFWKQVLPDTLFLSPNAPFHYDQGEGFQWFSITGVTPETRSARILEARASFDSTIHHLLAEYDIDPNEDKVVFVGFSQGSIMSLDALVSGRFPLSAVVAFSGRLASPEPFVNGEGKPVLLIHGKSDPMISWQESDAAQKTLSQLGFAAQAHYEQDTVHTISPQGAMLAAEFITRCFS